MQEVNFFYDRHPIKVVGVNTGRVYAAGAEADCFRLLHEKHSTGANLSKDYGTYPEPLRVIRLKEKPTGGNQ